MAARDPNLVLPPALPAGMNPAEDGESFWIQNLSRRNARGGWATRPGFGLLARVDSSLTAGKISDQQDMGIQRVLGVHTYRTAWGGTQILALCRTQAWLGDQKDVTVAAFGVVYSLFVYDVDFDTTREHVLHRHTSQAGTPVWQRRGHYNTDIEVDRQQWVDAGQAPFLEDRDPIDREEAWFTDPLLGNIIFGTPNAGPWVYTPAPPARVRTQANTTTPRETAPSLSEDPLVVPLLARSSYLEDEGGYTYYTAEEFGRPSAAVVIHNRVAYAIGRTVLYSNPEDPSAIVIENTDVFEDPIIALGSILGLLYVCTKAQTFLVSPASGFIISGGDVRLVSGTVGALGPSALARYGPYLALAHTTGVYVLDGGVGMTKISSPLDPFFHQDGLANLWTQFSQAGLVPTGQNPPRSYYRLDDQTRIGAGLTADADGRLFFTLPRLGLTFCYEENGWHVWSYTTLVNNDLEVLATSNLPRPRLTALGQRVFMVAGPTTQAQTDLTKNEFSTSPNRSIAFLELGRGGSLDRNSGIAEDRRFVAGEWLQSPINLQTGTPPRQRGFYYLGPPTKLPPGTTLGWANTTIGSSDIAFWLPITFTPPTAVIDQVGGWNVRSFYLTFSFDNTNFEPIINPAAAKNYEPIYQLPTERLSAQAAYALGTADEALTKGVYVFNTGTGLPDAAGDEIRIYIDSAFGGSWTGHPNFGFQPKYKNPILSIAFRSRKTSGAINGFATEGRTGSCTGFLGTYPVGAYTWRDAPMTVRYAWEEAGGTEEQAIDWMIDSGELTADGNRLRTRGVTLSATSSGSSTSVVVGAAYPRGLLNLALSAARKGLSGQTTDITPPDGQPLGFQAVGKDPTVPRLGNPVTRAVFNGSGAWGDDGDPSKGNLLVADTPTDRLTISGRMSGDALKLTLFGHIRSKAEDIRVLAASIIARVRSAGPRRRGR